MKQIVKKNQIIIAALAVMIAAAGYLNYSGKIFGDKKEAETANADLASKELLDISEEDLASASDDIKSQDGGEEDGSVDNTGEEDYPNVAEGKAVKTSSADTTQSNVAGSNAVDGKDDTKWVSVNLRTESPQWLQIDLGETRTTVGRIEVKFDGVAWDQGYEIQTYDTEKNAQRHTVKTVGANGPSSSADANEKRTDVTVILSKLVDTFSSRIL